MLYWFVPLALEPPEEELAAPDDEEEELTAAVAAAVAALLASAEDDEDAAIVRPGKPEVAAGVGAVGKAPVLTRATLGRPLGRWLTHRNVSTLSPSEEATDSGGTGNERRATVGLAALAGPELSYHDACTMKTGGQVEGRKPREGCECGLQGKLKTGTVISTPAWYSEVRCTLGRGASR